MSDAVKVLRGKTFFLCHICSKCGAPVLIIGDAYSKAVAFTTLLNGVSGLDAIKKAHTEIEKVEQKIIDCANTHCYLGSIAPPQKDSWLGETYQDRSNKNVWSSTWLELDDVPCPSCNHLEPWQKSDVQANEFDLLSKENYPVLYHNMSRAILWMLIQQQKMIVECDVVSIDSLSEEKLKTERQNLEGKLKQIEEQYSNEENEYFLNKYITDRKQLLEQQNAPKSRGSKEKNDSSLDMRTLDIKIKEVKKTIDNNKQLLYEKRSPVLKQIRKTDRKRLCRAGTVTCVVSNQGFSFQ